MGKRLFKERGNLEDFQDFKLGVFNEIFRSSKERNLERRRKSGAAEGSKQEVLRERERKRKNEKEERMTDGASTSNDPCSSFSLQLCYN